MSRTKRKSRSPKRSTRRSKFEVKVEEILNDVCKEVAYEPETLEYSLHLKYKPDWRIDNGIFIEAKGLFDYETRRKMLAVKEKNPDKDIRMVFMRNQKIARNSKMTYGDWCDKHGFPWSVYPELPL